jgi:hypothetical protein
MRKTFTLSELTTLRNEFSAIRTVNPDRLGDFHAIFDGCEDDALRQLAIANINFVSKLARNACTRRGL